MSKSKSVCRMLSGPVREFVPHPRYGALPHHSGVRVPEEEIRASHWNLRSARFYPDSVLRAGDSDWYFGGHRYYVDLEKTCVDCGRCFLFFAREQRYWYEALRLHHNSEARACVPCRRRVRAERAALARLAAGAKAERLSNKAMLALVDDAAALAEAGVLKRVERLGAMKNRALRQCGENPRIARLARATAEVAAAARAPD